MKSFFKAILFLCISSAFAEVQITRQPVSQEVPLGQPATFSAEAAAAQGEDIFFQWYFNERPILGATGSSFTIANVQSTNLGNYFVKVGNLLNSKESVRVSLTGTLGVTSQVFPAIELQFATQPGRVYIIQSSTNLANWTTVSEPVVASSNSFSKFISAKQNTYTFYRVINRLDGAALPYLNGTSLFFTPANNPSGQFQIQFTGTPATLTGNYLASGAVVDSGTYTYSRTTTTGNIDLRNGPAQALYELDFVKLTYVKSLFGQVVETGAFSY